MKWFRQHDHDDDEIDEHDLPTEPVLKHRGGQRESGYNSQPGMPQSGYNSQSGMPQNGYSSQPGIAQSMYGPPAAVPVYPVLPPAPVYKGVALPPGGASAYAAPSASMAPAAPARSRSKRAGRYGRAVLPRGLILALLDPAFVLIQLLLLARFVLLFVTLPWSGAAAAANVIVALGDVLAAPTRLLLQQVPLPTLFDPAISILLSILLYGLLGRLLLRILKAVWRAR